MLILLKKTVICLRIIILVNCFSSKPPSKTAALRRKMLILFYPKLFEPIRYFFKVRAIARRH